MAAVVRAQARSRAAVDLRGSTPARRSTTLHSWAYRCSRKSRALYCTGADTSTVSASGSVAAAPSPVSTYSSVVLPTPRAPLTAMAPAPRSNASARSRAVSPRSSSWSAAVPARPGAVRSCNGADSGALTASRNADCSRARTMSRSSPCQSANADTTARTVFQVTPTSTMSNTVRHARIVNRSGSDRPDAATAPAQCRRWAAPPADVTIRHATTNWGTSRSTAGTITRSARPRTSAA